MIALTPALAVRSSEIRIGSYWTFAICKQQHEVQRGHEDKHDMKLAFRGLTIEQGTLTIHSGLKFKAEGVKTQETDRGAWPL